MFVNLQCGTCDSSMKIDLEYVVKRNEENRHNIFREYSHIKCPACASRLPDEVAYNLYSLINSYRESETNWKLSFEIKDVKTSNDTP